TTTKNKKKKKNRKGGLSMFLSGALDNNVPKTVVPPQVISKVEVPAWGGVKISQASTPLRVILDEQSRSKEKSNSATKTVVHENKTSSKISLNSVLGSSPVPMSSSHLKLVVSDGDKSTSPWPVAASCTPPSGSRPSLRDIQKQQQQQLQSISHSPKMRTTGFSVGSPSSEMNSNGMSRWFKPETDAPSSIRSIQIEEKAMKDLKRFYTSVRIAKNQS
ncbi:hypothetical protein M569_10901, partial [Genlisea aurea]